MAKAEPLTIDVLAVPQITPMAATSPRRGPPPSKKVTPTPVGLKPLQLRLTRADVREIKIAAAQEEQTISDFMLACFHAYIKTR